MGIAVRNEQVMDFSLTDVLEAAKRIRGRVRRTPVLELEHEDLFHGGPVWLKLEQLQHTGSFKPRGAFNRILKAAEERGIPEAGVVAASGGTPAWASRTRRTASESGRGSSFPRPPRG